jgi:hypothetical protein
VPPTQREVTDEDGTAWTCLQAYTGLAAGGSTEAAERAEGPGGEVTVVCTPGGGEQSVRLRLTAGWAEQLSDGELLERIAAARNGASG